MQEEYGIKLKILTDGLKNSITQIKSMIGNFKNDVKKDTKIKITIDPSYNINKLTDYKNKIESILSKLKEQRDFPGMWEPDEKLNFKIAKYEAGLKAIKERIAEIENEADNTKEKISGISISANMTNKTIINGFKDSWKSIKRFAFSLLSLRGIYGLVRKASSAYMAQDKGLAEQMQRTWASLGSLVAPVIKGLVNGIRTIAAYINYFVSKLTGKNLIGEAIDKINAYNKSLANTSKTAKKTSKDLTSLDEVTNLSFDDDATDGIEDAVQAFDDFGDIKLNENITRVLDNVAEKLKIVKKFLQPIIDWAVEHPEAIIKILGGAALVTLLGKLTGNGGLGTLASLLTPLVKIGIVAVGVDLIYNAVTGKHLIDDLKLIISEYKELQKDIDKNKESSETKAETLKNDNELLKQGVKTGKISNKVAKQNVDLILSQVKRSGELIDSYKEQQQYTLGFGKTYNKLQDSINAENEAYKSNMDTLKEYALQGKMTADQKEQYIKLLTTEIATNIKLAQTYGENSEKGKIYKNTAFELFQQLKNISNIEPMAEIKVESTDAENKTKNLKDKLIALQKKYYPELDLNVSTKDAKSKLTNFLTKTKEAMVATNLLQAMKGAAIQALINAIPSYDVGTNYVPNDQLAMVHKGEAIIPKKFNNQQTFSNNEETNALLIELNQNVIELRNRPNIFEINGKEFAQATYSDYQDEGNRLNQSMTIKRS